MVFQTPLRHIRLKLVVNGPCDLVPPSSTHWPLGKTSYPHWLALQQLLPSLQT